MNFREIPVATTYRGRDVGPARGSPIGVDDVFPEEFRTLLPIPRGVATFRARHGDLCTADAWRDLQGQHQHTDVPEFFPYPDEVRLS